jgi:glutaredoxin
MYRLAIGILCLAIAWMLWRPCDITVYRFYRPTCPYCVNSQAEWDKFQIYSLFSTTRTVNINLNDPQGSYLAKVYGVETVPTVIAVVDGYNEKYTGVRTADGYQEWINSI